VVVALTGLGIIYQAYIRPVKKTSAEASVIYSSNPSHRLEINGGKDIKDILPAFRQFVSETVLLGHNVAFDMKMLKVKEKSNYV
jgi:DNA polymerase-3 subunit epsilon